MYFRDYKVYHAWFMRTYRGKNLPLPQNLSEVGTYVCHNGEIIYPEHDDNYLKECLLNLKAKNVELTNSKTIDEWLIELDMKNFK